MLCYVAARSERNVQHPQRTNGTAHAHSVCAHAGDGKAGGQLYAEIVT
jgi:hypothetical protein